MRLLLPLLFLALALAPVSAEAKPQRGASECARFYVAVAQQEDVPHGVGQKVRWC